MRTVYCVALGAVISLGMTSMAMGRCHSCGQSADLGAEACSAPGYGTLDLSPGCCEDSPSCCDNVWAGYCQQRDDWKEFVPRFLRHKQAACACGSARRCRPGFCPFFSMFGRATPGAIVEVEIEAEEPTPVVSPAAEPPST